MNHLLWIPFGCIVWLLDAPPYTNHYIPTHIPVMMYYSLEEDPHPYSNLTDDGEPYTHHFLPEDGSEDSCCEPT